MAEGTATRANHKFRVFNKMVKWREGVQGVYIFAKAVKGVWCPLYIGRAKSFHGYVDRNHREWCEAKKLGMTHIHGKVINDPVQRAKVEKELIRKFKPPLNDIDVN